MQKHLEDIQVYLGKIDEWHDESFAEFLNGLFGTDLKVKISTSEHPRCAADICTKCFTNYSKHRFEKCANGAFGKFFHKPPPVTLLHENRLSRDEFTFNFDLGIADGRERLESFMNFIKM